jgi:hypothetical protein
MTVVAETQVIEDGPRNFVVHLTATLGSADSETTVKKVDITTLSALTNTAQKPTKLALEKIAYSTENFQVDLFWEGTPSDLILSLPANFSDTINYRKLSPIQNKAASKTGSVLLSAATNLTKAGSYAITLWFRKKYE